MRSLHFSIILLDNEDIPFKELIKINFEDDDVDRINLIDIYNFIIDNIGLDEINNCNIFFYNLNDFIIDQNIEFFDPYQKLSNIENDELLLIIQIKKND